ncbi:unnamed protein product [Prorocentrum cordatum]|uniref:Uncharacterized protein n=1 Tax=Prorocentrum cordatum TaxID=2364126 RepID=A0ABN9XRL0_9DINO|nr:unnamed protein product [Polarella glacialis]
MSSTTYVSAKKTGLANALNVSVSDVEITGFVIVTHPDRLPAAVRQLSRDSHVTVTTRFTVEIVGSKSAASLTAAIATMPDVIEAETNEAMAASDWSAETVITVAPTLTASSVGPAGSTAGVTTAPTPVPVVIGASMGAVAATGDPHLQNIFGERFDLMQAGRHLLVRSRGARAARSPCSAWRRRRRGSASCARTCISRS